MEHDCPVTVDEHGSVKNGIKGQISKFCNNSVVDFFNQIFACRQRSNIYETNRILVYLGVGGQSQN